MLHRLCAGVRRWVCKAVTTFSLAAGAPNLHQEFAVSLPSPPKRENRYADNPGCRALTAQSEQYRAQGPLHSYVVLCLLSIFQLIALQAPLGTRCLPLSCDGLRAQPEALPTGGCGRLASS